MKLPNVLRKADWLSTALDNPLGSAVLAEALVAAAGARAAALNTHRPEVKESAIARSEGVAQRPGATSDVIQPSVSTIGKVHRTGEGSDQPRRAQAAPRMSISCPVRTNADTSTLS